MKRIKTDNLEDKINRQRSAAAKKGAITRARNKALAERQKVRLHHKIIGAVLIVGVLALTFHSIVTELSTYAASNQPDYLIVGLANNCLTNRDAKLTSRNTLEIYPCIPSDAQRWTFEANGSIKSTSGNFCVDYKGANSKVGTKVWFYRCNGTGAQRFVLSDDKIVSRVTKLCLAVAGSSLADHATLVMNKCDTSSAMKWKLYGPTSAPTPTTASVPSKPAAPALAAGVTGPSNAPSGWHQVLKQEFSTNAAVGAFNGKYPHYSGYDGGVSGYSGTKWGNNKTVSVSDGILRMRQFRDASGTYTPALTPDVTGQMYGRWSVRFKSDSSDYWKIAWLLWPTSEKWSDGEIDYPENLLSSTIGWAAHNVTGNPESNENGHSSVRFDDGKWHTATIQWEPGKLSFIIDNNTFATMTNQSNIPKVPMRWALQNEVEVGKNPPVGAEASIYIDWITVDARN